MIPIRTLRSRRSGVRNIRHTSRRPPTNLSRILAIAAVAVPAGGLTMCGPAARVQAAGDEGTIVAIQRGDGASELIAIDPEGSSAHLVGTGDPLASVSMANDGTIYVVSDSTYDQDDDHIYTLTQNGTLLDSWKVPNPGEGQLLGGISDSEIRRDGQRLMSQSVWSDCNGGGLTEICNVRDITVPGSSTSLGDMINESTAHWLGNTDYVIVNGGLEYYKIGDEDTQEWFDDEALTGQWDADATTTADGSILAVGSRANVHPDPEEFEGSTVIAFYELNGLPPAAPTATCWIDMRDLLGDQWEWDHYLDNVSFSPSGNDLAFTAGPDFDDKSIYVIRDVDTETCDYAEVEKLYGPGVQDVFWGHFGYDPDHGPAGPGNPGNPGQGGGVIAPVAPARYWDTRNEPTFDGEEQATGRLAGEQTRAIQIAGRGGVPADAAGVVANLTVVNPDGPGFATLFPCTDQPPTASHLNYAPGAVAANNAVVPLDDSGRVCVFTKAGADFVLDVNGFVPAASKLTGITPARYLDTRPGSSTFDGAARGQGEVTGGQHIEVQIAGRGQVPAGAIAALVNVTAVGTADAGYVTLYPCGQRPGTSTLNYGPADVVPNGAFVNLSADGTVCAFTKATTHLLIDVAGYVPAGTTGIAPIVPARLLDTRPGEPTVDGESSGEGRVASEGVIEVQVTGRGTVPANAKSAMFNITVVGPDGPGFATLYPCGDLPKASNVNFSAAGVVRANNAMTQLSPSGSVCIFVKSATDVVLDVTGWVA